MPGTRNSVGDRWALAIHGGAGDLDDATFTDEHEAELCAAMSAVLRTGASALAAGEPSLDVVEQAVRALEDSPLFNAGRGAVFNARGEHELEASIMDGRTLEAGAVANLRGVKNPVALARKVMERSAHVFLQGAGAIEFAKTVDVELVDPAYFWTEARWQALEQARREAASGTAQDCGTVGAVALDRNGNLAAATSTGGMTNKLPGRVGDSAIIGAGNYASNASCAVSATGHGEYFIRATIARDVAAMIEYSAMEVAAAAEAAISGRLATLGGTGGVVVVDREGNVAMVFNTERMNRACISDTQPLQVAVRPARSRSPAAEP